MGIIEHLCEEKEWDLALGATNNLIEHIMDMQNHDQWEVPGIDPDDILYAMFVLGDEIISAKDNEFADINDEIPEFDCVDCDEKNCSNRVKEFVPVRKRCRK